jgi:uncharacterized protein (DUF1501 family)
MWTRRTFLQRSAIAASLFALPGLRRSARASTAARRPKRLVQIRLSGGFDAILATDPKTRAEVAPEIDVPYEAAAIREIAGVRLGPLGHWLEPHLPRTAILNGVVCSTVAHATGNRQIRQMRRRYPTGSPGLTSLLGPLIQEEAPFADATNDPDLTLPPSRQLAFVPGLLERLAALGGSDLKRHALRDAAADARAHCSVDCMPLDAVSRLLSQLPSAALAEPPKLALAPHQPGLPDQPLRYASDWLSDHAQMFRDVLYVLEHDLARAVYVSTPGDWDTHQFNLRFQQLNMAAFAASMSWFLDQLQRRSAPDGQPLAETTGVVMCSELGRFPCVNEFQGKDHFPEMPVVLIGPGLRPGQYGRTDRRMISLPISIDSGREPRRSADGPPTLDDVGATLLHWLGIEDAATLGFVGRRLDFLLG